MALQRDVVIRLLGDADSAIRAQRAAADAAGVSEAAYRRAEREQQRQARAAEEAARRQREAMDKVGKGAVLMGTAVIAGLGMAAKAAIDWETAWTGVTKTVNGTPKQLADVEKGLRNLARTLPSTHEEIAAVAEAAGQLGIKTSSIVSFTKTMIDLGQSTNLTADEAATALARFSNIMGTPQDEVSNLGASLVALGNAGASTEKEILDMAVRMASAGHQIGLTAGDVLGIANALSSVGIEAEAGGTAFSTVMLSMRSAVDEGGKSLDAFADVAGMTADQFKQQFQTNAGGAIAAFVKGLADMEAKGKSTQPILAELGFTNVRVGNALRASAAAADMFTGSLKMGNTAFAQNTALIREASKRYDTTASKMAISRNNLHDAAITIGQEFLPAIAGVADKISAVAKWFAGLPGPVKAVVAELGGVAGVVGLVGGAFLLLIPRVTTTITALRTLRTEAPRTATALAGIGKVAGAATALLALKAAADGLIDSFGPKTANVEATTDALLALGDSTDKVNKLLKTGGGDFFESDINNIADAAARLTQPGFGNRVEDFIDGIGHLWHQGSPERQHLINQLGQMGQSLAVMVQSGNADRAKEIFGQLATEWKKGGGTVKQLRDLMPEYTKALQGAANDQKQAAETAKAQQAATRALAGDTDTAYSSIDNYAKALGLSDDEAADFIKATQDMGASLADFADPLDTYKTMLQDKKQAEQDAAQATADATKSTKDSWKDYVKDVGVSFSEYLAQLEKQVKDQENWQTNMLRLAGRVSQGTLEELAKMGPQGASLVAQMVNASDSQLARFDDVTAKRSKDATDAWGAELTMAQPVLAAVAAKAGQGVVDKLAAKLQAGTITVADIANQYGINLANGVNPLLSALGADRINLGSHRVITRLGHVVAQADGGLLENHTAQIAPGGSWRMWAEPETGGEAYIPLSPAKRVRSVAIWRETGRRLNQYADGGFASPSDVPRPYSTAPYRPPISTAGDASMGREYQAVTDWLRAHAPTVSGVSVPATAVAAIVRSVASSFGWGAGAEWNALAWIISHESGWRNTAQNPTSTAYGLFQFLDSTWGGVGGVKTSDPRLQSIYGMRYIGGRYGDPIGAQRFWAANGYYADGTDYVRKTGPAYLHQSEAVLNPREAAAYRTGLAAGSGMPVGASRGGSAPLVVPPPVVKVYLDGQEWRGIARVEARGVVAARDSSNARSLRSNR